MKNGWKWGVALAALSIAGSLGAQDLSRSSMRTANYYVVPQNRAYAMEKRRKPIKIELVSVKVEILERTARTTLAVYLRNPSGRQEEAVLLLPVPAGAAVSDFTFKGQTKAATARVLSREEARRTYNQIVRKLKDPALLEFAGHNLVRSSVFPIAAGGTQMIRLIYEHLLEADGERVDYVLPRSASLEQRIAWTIHMEVRSKKPISMIYSPTHDLAITRHTPQHMSVTVDRKSLFDPGEFRISYLVAKAEGMTASLFAYPDPKIGGGYFLLMAGLPEQKKEHRHRVKREITIVLDRSGSMAGPKMDQVKAAALQVIEGLADGESFNIIDYSTTVECFAKSAVIKDRKNTLAARAYLDQLRSMGGTNIHDALIEALRPEPVAGSLPIILFLTDGLPTVGRTAETVIRDVLVKGNRFKRRVFTFGVGNDVNVPLLDAIADLSRATATYVQPKEQVEVKVAAVFRRLFGPVLASPVLTVLDEKGQVDTRRVRERQPHELRDLFDRDQLIVLGQYRGDQPLRFQLSGNYFGNARNFTFEFSLDKSTTRNSFVPRLWATRQIAYLVDKIRLAGAASGGVPQVARYDPFQDPRNKELLSEIMRLSTEFGVLSEYTSFLATEGTLLGNWADLERACAQNLNSKAVKIRSGIGAVNQGANLRQQKGQTRLNLRNRFLNDKLERVEISTVQQFGDRAFFKRGTGWIDGRLLQAAEFKPTKEIRLGTQAYDDLLQKLIRMGRQATLSLKGDILLKIDGKVLRIINR